MLPGTLWGSPRSGDVPSEEVRVDSTRNLVLSLFRAQERGNRSLLAMASLLEDFTRAGTLHARLDSLVAFYSWVRRSDDRLPELRLLDVTATDMPSWPDPRHPLTALFMV